MNNWALILGYRMIVGEFPGWEITHWQTSARVVMWSAFWRSEDGSQRRYLVAGSADELLIKLRAMEQDASRHGHLGLAPQNP